MLKIFSWLGVLAGAISVFRLLYLWFEFDLSVPASLMLGFYEDFFHPLVSWMKQLILAAVSWLGVIDLPDGWQDVLILYVVMFFAMIRFLRSAYFDSKQDPVTAENVRLTPTVFATAFDLPDVGPLTSKPSLFAIDVLISLVWPLLPVLYGIASIFVGRSYRRRVGATIGGWLVEIGKVVGGAVLFVATNAAATSIDG